MLAFIFCVLGLVLWTGLHSSWTRSRIVYMETFLASGSAKKFSEICVLVHYSDVVMLDTAYSINKASMLTRVGHILKKSHEGHLGVFFDPQKEIVITSELLRISQLNFTLVSHIWSEIWKYVKKFVSKMAAKMAAEKFRIECISARLSNKETNKVSIHMK